ncbi:FecR family protein [uncultured Formosa sp.]|uniref:FecR family protein n=1 Tax=uncultured Formosa sp. TaxID=255435 RepID=UPI002625FA6F|nr:FecR family protein [uncultured Formosa sp.]
MNEKNFKRILKKYENGVASEKDIEIIDAFFDAMHTAGEDPKTFKHNLALKNKIYKKIEQKKHTKINWNWKIAASIVALIGFSLFNLINNQEFFNSHTQNLIESHLGEQTQVHLPDGSTVILNGKSSLQYPNAFKDSIRLVKLKGQAFFNVTKNPNQPFVIQSGSITTKVLGTSFNIIENDTTVQVVVSTGLVNVSSQLASVYLKPNQKVIYNRTSHQLKKTNVNAELINLWWKGEVVLKQIKIQELATELEKLYGLPFIIKDDAVKKMYLYSLRLSRDEPLQELIARINFINEIHLINHNTMIEITKD